MLQAAQMSSFGGPRAEQTSPTETDQLPLLRPLRLPAAGMACMRPASSHGSRQPSSGGSWWWAAASSQMHRAQHLRQLLRWQPLLLQAEPALQHGCP
jgi:hypothetical protein